MYPGKDFREQSDENWEYADEKYLGGTIPNKKFKDDPKNNFPIVKFRTLSEAQRACLLDYETNCSGITRLGKGVKNTFFELRTGKTLLPAIQARSWKRKA